MNTKTSGLFVFFAFILALTAHGWAAGNSGLWVGTATIDSVSEVNKPRSDLSFDLRLDGVLKEESLISKQGVWKYDTGTDRGTAWRGVSYNDSAWSSGQGPLGYGGKGEATTVSFGGNPSNKYPTVYFRKGFAVGDPSVYSSLLLKLRRDDGAMVYLNGSLVLRYNLPTSFVGYGTLALSEVSGGDETAYHETSIPASLLTAGTNVIAVEIHQSSLSGADLGFDLALSASLKSPTAATFIDPGSNGWRYYDAGDELPASWKDPGYAEPGWKTGEAQFGYGDGDEKTVVSYGPDASNKSPVVYFRKSFNVADSSRFSHLKTYLLRDDGAVVYLNGTEIMRSNMPSGAVGFRTSPVQSVPSSEENTFFASETASLALASGANVIAVGVHQHIGELGDMDGTGPPSPASAPLSLNLLIHVDDGGTVRLLKEVVQMWEDGTYNPDGTVATSGRYLLIVNDEKLHLYKGIGRRDGTPVGRRLSSVGFDFDGRYRSMSGSLAPGSALSASFTLPYNHPTNPFMHKYHPDFDNKNATYTGVLGEALEVGRTVTLEISNRYPPDLNEAERTPPPGWGDSVMGGIYRETVTGLHKDPIESVGYFTLRRVTDTETLIE